MKMISIVKKNKLLALVALAYLVLLIISPEMAKKSVGNSLYYLLEMFQVLPVIFLFTVVIDALVPKAMIMQGFGEKSGFKGNLLALLLGSISAGPIYTAFPISKSLLSKGASVSNIVIILSAWAVIKVPMLANEAKFLGVDFMLVRWILTVIAILFMAYITRLIVKKKDLPDDRQTKATLEIKEEYCIGCALCVKLLPQFYAMDSNKAVVIKMPEKIKDFQAIQRTVDKCPSKAIILDEEHVS